LLYFRHSKTKWKLSRERVKTKISEDKELSDSRCFTEGTIRDWSAVLKFPSFDLPSQVRENQSPYVSRPPAKFPLPWLTIPDWGAGFASLPLSLSLSLSLSLWNARARLDFALHPNMPRNWSIERDVCRLTTAMECYLRGNSVFLIARGKTFKKLYWKLRADPICLPRSDYLLDQCAKFWIQTLRDSRWKRYVFYDYYRGYGKRENMLQLRNVQ